MIKLLKMFATYMPQATTILKSRKQIIVLTKGCSRPGGRHSDLLFLL